MPQSPLLDNSGRLEPLADPEPSPASRENRPGGPSKARRRFVPHGGRSRPRKNRELGNFSGGHARRAQEAAINKGAAGRILFPRGAKNGERGEGVDGWEGG